MPIARETIELITAIMLLFAAILPLFKRKRTQSAITVKMEFEAETQSDFLPLYCKIISIMTTLGLLLAMFSLRTAGTAIVAIAYFYCVMAFPQRRYPPVRQEIYTMFTTLGVLIFLLLLYVAGKQNMP